MKSSSQSYTITECPEDEKKRSIKKGKCHYFALIVLLLGIIAVVGVVIWIGTSLQNDDKEEVESDGDSGEDQDGPDGIDDVPKEQVDAWMTVTRLQQKMGSSPQAYIANFTNLDGTVARSNQVFVAPSSLEEIQAVVQAAGELEFKARCVGSAYSYADLWADKDGIMIEMKNLQTRFDGAPMVVNEENGMKTVTVASGITIDKLSEFFVENLVQIRSTATAFNIQIGGLVSTASHGGSVHDATVSDYMVGARLVDANGYLQAYNIWEHPQQMAALRCCVGMCGVLYDVTLKVEPLYNTMVSNYFVPMDELITYPTGDRFIGKILQDTDVFIHYAPFASLSDDQWAEYDRTSKIPESYDPWKDMAWITGYTQTNKATSLARRKRRSTERTSNNPLLQGRLPRASETAGGNVTTPSADPTTTTTQAAPAGPGILRLIHEAAYKQVYNLYSGDDDEHESLHPYAVSAVDGSTLPVTTSVEFFFKDDIDYNNTRKALDFVFVKLREQALEGQMPILTMVLRWINTSSNCDLCPNSYDSDAPHHVFSLEFISAFYKPEFPSFMNTMFPLLKDRFPSLRVKWSAFDNSMDDIQSYMKDSLGDKLNDFLSTRQQANWDPKNTFTNKFLLGIVQ